MKCPKCGAEMRLTGIEVNDREITIRLCDECGHEEDGDETPAGRLEPYND